MSKYVLTQGAITEVVGCYTKDYRIDNGAMKAQIDFQCDAGIKGIFGNSLSSNCQLLHDNMDEDLVRIMVKAADGRIPVMVQVFENNLSRAQEKLKIYKNMGADVILLSQPYMRGMTEDGLRRYFCTLFEQGEGVTMGLHNSPNRFGYFGPEIIAEMANRYEHCVYIKNATLSMSHIQRLHLLVKNPDFRYYEGSDSTILATMVGGGHGVVSAISSLFPKIVIDLCDACLAGDWETAKLLNNRVSWLRYIDYLPTSGSIMRFMADSIGAFPGGPEMPPNQPLTEEDREILRREYAKLDWIERKFL